MTTKKKSGRLSKASKARKPACRTKLGRERLKVAAPYSRGEMSLPVRLVNILPAVDVRKIRVQAGLSQSEFAARYGFSHRTLQEWEQGRVQPDGATRAYLTVIECNPHAVEAALSGRFQAAADRGMIARTLLIRNENRTNGSPSALPGIIPSQRSGPSLAICPVSPANPNHLLLRLRRLARNCRPHRHRPPQHIVRKEKLAVIRHHHDLHLVR